MTKRNDERGAALLEAAMTLPLLLLIAVGIFEFGRAYQTWLVLTNAAREGARYAITPGSTGDNATAISRQYMEISGLDNYATAVVNVNSNVPLAVGSGTEVLINYPFEFILLQPVAQLVVSGAQAGAPITMSVKAVMRNEAP
jgi:Flp pilus assembly protein TadG